VLLVYFAPIQPPDMNKLLLVLITGIILFSAYIAHAQTDTLRPGKDSVAAQIGQQSDSGEDDDFNAGLLVVGTCFVCAMIGAAIVGSFAAAFVILAVILFISAGVISTSLFVALYKKSVAAGFKTLITIICIIGGVAIGSTGLFLIKKIFHLHISGQTAFFTGAAGGFLGGLLIGWLVFKIFVIALNYFKKKLQIG